jgi:protein-S-isoprenylcysteine O-methyltransferase Ste14
VLFTLLGYFTLMKLVGQVHRISAQASFTGVLEGPLPTALYLCFCAIPVGIYLVRPRPHARDGRVVARASAFVGTLMLLGVGALPVPFTFHLPVAARIVATPMAILAFSMELFGLAHLRRNLSIIPEARRLVTSGPYRFVRHPLYLGEVLAAVSAVLANPGLWAAVSIPPFVAVQLLRAHFEEQLLARTFPQYDAYRRRTHRLIPLVW